jgi:hypothetical protein
MNDIKQLVKNKPKHLTAHGIYPLQPTVCLNLIAIFLKFHYYAMMKWPWPIKLLLPTSNTRLSARLNSLSGFVF